MLKRKFLAILMMICLLTIVVCVPGAMAEVFSNASATANGSEITVRVTGGEAGETLAFQWSGNSATAPWNSAGVYVFSGIPNGSGSVTVTSPSGGSINTNSITVGPTTVDISITVTNNGINTISVTGKGKANTDVLLKIADVEQARKTSDASGNFSFTWTTSTGGNYPVKVEYVNGTSDGNAATWSSAVNLTGPVDLSVTAPQLIGSGLHVSGKGAPNGNILISVDGRPGITANIDGNGNYQEVITLPVGTYTTVEVKYNGTSNTYGTTTAVTSSGNWVVAAASNDDITITKVTPGVLSIVVEGNAKTGSTVRVTVGGSNGASGTQNITDGTFKITVPLAAGTYTGASATYTASGIGNGASTSDRYTISDNASATPTPTPAPGVTPTPAPGSYPTLYRGMVNAYVTTLQLYLKDLGYYTIKVDGIYGVGTETAVRNFQIMNNLSANGVADDATQKLLYSGNAIGIGGGGVTPPSGYSTLRYGSRGTAVRTMQTRLAKLGYYYGAIDGIFGSQSEAAVRQFQNRNNLAVTGIADSATQTAIYNSSALSNGNASAGYVYLHYGSKGSAVVRLQTALKNAGYYKGVVDGLYYDQTFSSVKAFQRARGLVVDGIAGKKTQNALYGTNY